MTNLTVTPGTKVRFTANRLGLTAYSGAPKYEPDAEVNEGDKGVYHTPHPILADEDWHIIKVGELYCPCHGSQFEVVND